MQNRIKSSPSYQQHRRQTKRVVSLSRMAIIYAIALILPLMSKITFTHAFINDAIQRVQKDFVALTRRVTARHILVTNEEVASAIKNQIRTKCIEKERYVVNVFEEAAKKYSQDETTKLSGGLIGTLVPPGYCRSTILDRACFEVSLGQVIGPIEDNGLYHLLLITERTNCPKLDGEKTQLIQTRGDDVFGSLVIPSKSNNSNNNNAVDLTHPGKIFMDQISFWLMVMIAGGIVAELAEKIV